MEMLWNLLFRCLPLLTKISEHDSFLGFIAFYHLCCTMTAKMIRSESQSRAAKWLVVHNQSLVKERWSRSHSPVVEKVHDQTARERSLNRSDQQGPSQSSNDPMDWAKELPLQQKENRKVQKGV